MRRWSKARFTHLISLVFKNDVTFKISGKLSKKQLQEKTLKLIKSWADYSSLQDENLDALLIEQVREEEKHWRGLESEKSLAIDKLVDVIWRRLF